MRGHSLCTMYIKAVVQQPRTASILALEKQALLRLCCLFLHTGQNAQPSMLNS